MKASTTATESVRLRVAILCLISIWAFSSRLFSILRFESVIHEFDPWFNYRTTIELVENGFYDFVNWFDELSWYPLGRVVGGTVYPGIMITAGLIHKVLNLLNFPLHIREVCVFLAPVFSAFTAIAAYLLTCEMKGPSAGLLAAAFLGVAPGYISRSVAGSYDNEGISIFLLVITFYYWIKAIKLGSAFYGTITALFYFWMVSAWGGYVFIINLIPLHAFTLLVMGRYSHKLYVSYSTFYVIGTLSSMQIPFVGFQPTRTNDHMAALGVFGLLQVVALVQVIRTYLSWEDFKVIFYLVISGFFVAGFTGLVALTLGGYIAPWTGRFYSLWDTGYAKIHIPIIASVSEHQPTAWTSFFWDLQILVPLFPVGIWLSFRHLRDEHIFLILYGTTSAYFAGVMVRLMLTLTPLVCVCAAMAVSHFYDLFLLSKNPNPKEAVDADNHKSDSTKSESAKSVKSKADNKASKPYLPFVHSVNVRFLLVSVVTLLLCQFGWHCAWVTSNAYSSPSIVLATRRHDGSQHIIDDFREAYFWLRQNTHEKAKILSWWDYGYQITGMSNRTVLVDNNTWNNTHIATVGKVMSCSENVSYDVMRRHDVDYLLVIFGSAIGFSGDDINKFLWMVRIGEGVYPKDISERNFFTPQGEYRVDDRATQTMKESLMYKMSYYRFTDMFGGQPAQDSVRGQTIPNTPITLTTIDEVYTTENWLVRIYQVKKPDNIGRPMGAAASFGKKRRRPNRRSIGS